MHWRASKDKFEALTKELGCGHGLLLSEIRIDTSAVAGAWQQARDAVLAALSAKRSDPLTAASLSTDAQAKIESYEAIATEIQSMSDSLAAANETVKRVKESVKTGSISTAEVELKRLRATKARYSTANLTLCTADLDEKTAKETAEAEKLVAQQALDTYRATVFPNYQTAINTYLSRLGTGFTIVNIESQPTGGRPSGVLPSHQRTSSARRSKHGLRRKPHVQNDPQCRRSQQPRLGIFPGRIGSGSEPSKPNRCSRRSYVEFGQTPKNGNNSGDTHALANGRTNNRHVTRRIFSVQNL